MSRIVCHFSCGAASAVATKLVIADHGTDNLLILNAFIQEEHPDNRRFLRDCERWFGHPVKVVSEEKYGASVHRIWRERRFIKSVYGAICSSELKRGIVDAACLPSDRHVYGFTAEESDFPDVFARTVQIQEEIGPNSYFFYDQKTKTRAGLIDLKPYEGTHDETVPECSFFCAMAEEDMA